MPDEIINMADMGIIFSVTDTMGIHRESVSVQDNLTPLRALRRPIVKRSDN